MKFEDYYDQMSVVEVQKLNRVWKIISSRESEKLKGKSYMKSAAIDLLLKRGYFDKALKGRVEGILIGDKDREYLKYKALGLDLPYGEVKKHLREYFILFEEDIPDDYAEVILKHIKSEADLMASDEAVNVQPTPFLKLILMLNHVYKNKLEIQEMFKVVDTEKGLVNRRHIDYYLQTRQLITNDERYIDADKLYKWIDNKNESLLDFYQFLTIQLNAKGIFDFFNMIIKILEDSDKWISINDVKKVFCQFKKAVEVGIELGLIYEIVYNNQKYIKLSPEVWYMIMGKRPSYWNREEILVTPLKEVFIPYNFDPFVIQLIDYFNVTKSKSNSPIKYFDDYFIVSNIGKMPGGEEKFKFIEMTKYIEEYCACIPDIVKNEVLLS
ncbi:MAG: hypothetical protein JJT76_09470 [Clostridiaceae bacterium]|nr:hypothetical protein [Clostridiaceae bacterium]